MVTPVPWTTEQLKAHVEAVATERDRRYGERFDAQQEAVKIAIVAAAARFNDHLEAVKEANEAAFESSNKAIEKAEYAQAKRNEVANEFRAQLGDQAATLMPRKEYETSHRSLEDKLEARVHIVDTRLEEVRRSVVDLNTSMMPRTEVRLLHDSQVARQEAMQRTMTELAQGVVALRSELNGIDTGEAGAQHSADRTRTMVFALLGATFAVISLYFGLHVRTVTASPPASTTVTTKAP